MSIYASIGELFLSDDDMDDAESLEDLVFVYIQAVPGHIRDVGPKWEWLALPVEDDDALRAVFFCAPWTEKGTERNGQEYTDYLLQLTGEEYASTPFPEVLRRLSEAIGEHMDCVEREARRQARRRGWRG